MTYTTEEAISMAREHCVPETDFGYTYYCFTDDNLVTYANAIRQKTLEEAAGEGGVMRTRVVDEQKHERLMMDCIKMLSALESWSFADRHRMPDYLLESLNELVLRLEGEVLK